MIGTIISNQETPSTKAFSFVLAPGKRVAIGQLVKSNTGSGEVVALVKNIARQNRYYEFAESTSQFAKEKNLDSSFPARDWEFVVVQCSILGLHAEALMRCAFPPSPGDGVFEVEEELAKKVLGMSEKGLALGNLVASKVDCRIDLSRLLQKHLAVLGMSGSGKSHLVSVIIEEILSRPVGQRLGVIVLDPHGDYSSFAHSTSGFAGVTSVIRGDKVQIAASHLSPPLLSELVPSVSSPARREYAKIFSKTRAGCESEGRPLSIDELIAAAEESRTNLSDILTEVKDLKLFGLFDSPPLTVVKPGRLVIFNLSGISLRSKQVIASFFARKLFHLRQSGAVPPFALFVEEAHLFCREKAQRENAISKPVIETIAREGRKFGACLCLVSQRPVQLSTTALSQCSTFIVMRVTNPYDLQHIGESCEGIDKSSLDAITSLHTGEGVVIGEAVNFPAFIKVRNKSVQTAASPSLDQLASEFESRNVELSEKDVEAFI
ncbi:ATP-binding protein [Candidatus Micrarchaeota archaeon]|nr:ATP-binding protein [Candidatus Micrarchaeota archaeon]